MSDIKHNPYPTQILANQVLIQRMEEKHYNDDGTPKYTYELMPTDHSVKSKEVFQVTCPTHGPWETFFNRHYTNGAGCIACAGKKQLTTEEWVAKAKEVHQDTYDYTPTTYISRNVPITYVCRSHGLITQRAADHLRGHGCPQCKQYGHGRSVPIEVKQERINAIHLEWQGKLDTSKLTPDLDVATPITVNCLADPTHGRFITTMHNLSHKRGCPKCAGNITKDTDQFKKELSAIFDNRVLVVSDYVSAKKKMLVRCVIHGEFAATPDSLLSGHGCPKCSGNQVLDTGEFIRRSMDVWGDKVFLYNRVEYVNSNTNVILTCKKHRVSFAQPPLAHLHHAYGCPVCRLDTSRDANIYLIKCMEEDGTVFYKVGVTEKLLTVRMAGEFMPYKYEVIYMEPHSNATAYDKEIEVKQFIAKACHYTPLIPFDGSVTECFTDLYSVLKKFFPKYDGSEVDTNLTSRTKWREQTLAK